MLCVFLVILVQASPCIAACPWEWRRLARLAAVATRRGHTGSTVRWCGDYDAGVAAVVDRHARMFLSDSAIIVQNGTLPNPHAIDFNQSMAEVFNSCGQSLTAGSHILRDSLTFSVHSV